MYDEIIETLNCQKIIAASEHSGDMLLYSMMSEWIRQITFDVDPLLGSGKTGVTHQYLTDRTANILMDLTRPILGIETDRPRATELAKWLIEQMLFIGELWSPANEHIICTPERPVCAWRNWVRTTGPRGEAARPMQIGLCHYMRMTEDARRQEQNRKQVLEQACAICPEKTIIPGDMDIIETSMGPKLARKFKDMTVYRSHLSGLKDEQKYFVLTCGWPYDVEPINWDKTSRWIVPGKRYVN